MQLVVGGRKRFKDLSDGQVIGARVVVASFRRRPLWLADNSGVQNQRQWGDVVSRIL